MYIYTYIYSWKKFYVNMCLGICGRILLSKARHKGDCLFKNDPPPLFFFNYKFPRNFVILFSTMHRLERFAIAEKFTKNTKDRRSTVVRSSIVSSAVVSFTVVSSTVVRSIAAVRSKGVPSTPPSPPRTFGKRIRRILPHIPKFILE